MKKIILFIVVSFYTILSAATFAAALNIYEKPDASSKIITSVQSGNQLIPIFYTDKKDWVKVANPQNGDVGWAKVSELKGPIVVTKVNGSEIQQQIIVDKEKQPVTYSIVQYSGPKKLTSDEAKKVIKDMEKRNDKMRASMQKVQENMQKTMREMFKSFDDGFFTFPVIQPIIVVPE